MKISDKKIALAELARLYPDAKPALRYTTPYELLVAVILSVIVTVIVLILDRVPVVRAPMILVVNAVDLNMEEAVCSTIKKYSRNFSVKSRNMTAQTLDLVIELRTEEGGALVQEIMQMKGITSASLLAHNGEATF